ncbi:hypothetical protein VNO78_16653 [Psophocarpus tetragonolobus]|uniref:Uncharacterized protein n=1 Tax=Psophocarpus tetragonolobus TaxID=3891 RepID=A0AAN9SI71_PSOTE
MLQLWFPQGRCQKRKERRWFPEGDSIIVLKILISDKGKKREGKEKALAEGTNARENNNNSDFALFYSLLS